MEILIALAVLAIIIVLCGLGDWWLAKHPLKKADERTKKYEYKGW